MPRMDDVPANVPSKAAAILEIPVNAEQFNRNTSAWFRSAGGADNARFGSGGGGHKVKHVDGSVGANAGIKLNVGSAETTASNSTALSTGHFKLLKRSVSLNEEAAKSTLTGKPRTATIRRGSVWANSTLSKPDNRHLLLLRTLIVCFNVCYIFLYVRMYVRIYFCDVG